jgi:membrane-bound lytic murein transglycosylase F
MPYIKTPQVLIQRLPSKDSSVQYIKDPNELKDKAIHVRINSSYFERLQHLSNEIGEPIRIVNINRWITPEECMAQVEKRIFDYTVVDRHIAVANNFYFKKLDHSLVLGINQNIAFGIRKDAEKLKERFDQWLKKYMQHPHYKFLKNNYFSGKEISTKSFESHYKMRYGKISPYDHFFQNNAKKYNVEWELLAAIIHHESKFTPNLIGAGGAFGLMQFMPSTGRKYGVSAASTPEEQIEAGAIKLGKDWNYYSEIKDETQRIKFILAAYNGGSGKLATARKLAVQNGLDPNLWEENVELMMRGRSIGNYVKSVYSKYLYYKYLEYK